MEIRFHLGENMNTKPLDTFIKLKLDFPVDELLQEIVPQMVDAEWKGGCYQSDDSVWCMVKLKNETIEKLNRNFGVPVHTDFYIWWYRYGKELIIHKDNNSPGSGRPIVGAVSLIGDFETVIYEEDKTTVIDKVTYGPGDFIILNNTGYYHGGKALGDTRISLHFYLDVLGDNTEIMNCLRS